MQSPTKLAIRELSVAFFLILFSILLNAQSGVKIKEHIVISPIQKPLLSTASGGDLTVQYQFSGESDPASAAEIFSPSSCYNVYFGSNLASAPLVTGTFQTAILLHAKTAGTLTYSYSAGGQNIGGGSITLDPCTENLWKNFGFSETFIFDKDSVVAEPGGGADANVYGSSGSDCLSNVGWSGSYYTTWTIVQGSEWGDFYLNNQDNLGKTCTRQPSEDGATLGFKLASNIPDSVSCIIIKASSNGIERFKRIYLPRPIIKLTTQQSTLKPLCDNDNKGPRTAKVIDYSKVKPDSVTISVKMPNGNPVPDYPFTLTAYVRDNSGGHDHTDNRPTGKFIHSTDTVMTFSDKTGSDGKATYKYLCSGIGGVDSLYVKGKTDKDTSTALILLNMGDFNELTAGLHYTLTGAYGEAGVTSPHRKNHFGTSKLIQKLKALADSLYADSSYVMRINDMSLINGGPFDCDTRTLWNTPHQNHREGGSADISHIATCYGKDIIMNEKFFKEILKELEGSLYPEGHYHVTFK